MIHQPVEHNPTHNGRSNSDFGVDPIIVGDTIELASTAAGSDILLITGEPIGDPVAMGGPFVMNIVAEIDYRRPRWSPSPR